MRIEFNEGDDRITSVLTPEASFALDAAFTTETLHDDTPRHFEYGTLEGQIDSVSTHYGKVSFELKFTSGGRTRCIVGEQVAMQLGGEVALRDAWAGTRILVSGRIDYAFGGEIASMEVEQISKNPIRNRSVQLNRSRLHGPPVRP